MTPVTETPLQRSCPDLVRDGRYLIASLDNREGGTLSLRWSRVRDEPLDVSLIELMEWGEAQARGDAPDETEEGDPAPAAPKQGGGKITKTGPDFVAWDDLLSYVHTVAADNVPAKITLVNLVKNLRLYHQWLDSGATVEWETYKKQYTTPETE
jgi:hypothetical protein